MYNFQIKLELTIFKLKAGQGKAGQGRARLSKARMVKGWQAWARVGRRVRPGLGRSRLGKTGQGKAGQD